MPQVALLPTCSLRKAPLRLGSGDPGAVVMRSALYYPYTAVRVCPGSLSRITKLSQHESDRRESEEGQRIAAEVLKIFGQATATVEPGDSPFNYPAFRKNDKPFGLI